MEAKYWFQFYNGQIYCLTLIDIHAKIFFVVCDKTIPKRFKWDLITQFLYKNWPYRRKLLTLKVLDALNKLNDSNRSFTNPIFRDIQISMFMINPFFDIHFFFPTWPRHENMLESERTVQLSKYHVQVALFKYKEAWETRLRHSSFINFNKS